ncbi:disease resistance protein (TIR-NBS-LRR class), partial [Trifolium pratense]
EEEKFVFLDIACCFKGYKLTRVEQILHAHHGDAMRDHISVLVEKSLIKISESDIVTLHDLIEEMGKEIVRRESPDPGKRSRLWASEDIIQVLEENTGTSKIEIIYPNSRIEVEWDGEAFKKMENLRTLIIKDGKFTESPKHLPNSLRILQLQHSLCLSWDLPSEFYPRKLTICNISTKSTLFTQKFKNIMVLNFDRHEFLTRIPNVSGLVNLEEFSFQDCVNLITVDDSVGLLGKLKTLRAMCCINLRRIPPLKLASLEELDLSMCSCLESFPPVVWLLGKLKTMSLRRCIKLRSIPPLKLTSLEKLDLSHCVSLENFPLVVDSFLGKVKTLLVQSCHNLMNGLLDKLKFLSIERCIMLRSIPPLRLVLDNCEELQEIKGIPPCLKTLSALNCKSLTTSCKIKLLNQELHEAGNTWFCFPRAKIPEWFDHHCLAGLSISFWFRNKFPAIALCVISPSTLDDSRRLVRVIINGNTFFYESDDKRHKSPAKMYHLHLFHMKMENFNDNIDKAFFENKWNHAEVDFGFPFMNSGIHVLKEKSSMNDVRFTKPENDA